MTRPIPCQHALILAFVSAYLAQEHESPTVIEIAVHIGYPYSTARRQVDSMVGKGLLVWPRHGLRREYWGSSRPPLQIDVFPQRTRERLPRIPGRISHDFDKKRVHG